ncbi:MAG TPA: polyprenyl synthetase family protein [Terriglobia bacterium]|nr:polyprenyl synthetase family protein [Terriglobia bacterium]
MTADNQRVVTPRPLTVKDVFDLVREDLERVEKEFCQQTVSSIQAITEIGQYLQVSGGKRLRPVLVLLASKLFGFEGDPAIRMGAAYEMIHSATLVHDDVIDKAETRRGQPSINSRWGNHMSVLAGDWLYMQAFSIALAERNFKILDLLIGLTQVMVEGELLQLAYLRKADLTEDDYFELTYRKTACLFSACLRTGALLADRPEEEENLLASYGINLGLAFQLIDDVLDFTSSEKKLGKPVGNDLREGKVTLPLIYLLQMCDPVDARKVSRVLEDGGFENVAFPEVLEMVDRYGALNAARKKAKEFADEAKRCLRVFPESIYKDALAYLPDFIIARES